MNDSMEPRGGQLPQPKQQIRLLRLGATEFGLLQAGLIARIVGEQVIVSVGLMGGKASPVAGFLPLEVALPQEYELARIPVKEVIKLFEAKEVEVTGNKKLVIAG